MAPAHSGSRLVSSRSYIDVLHLLDTKYLLHGPKARYGWVANPYRKPLLSFLPTGTCTLQDAPSFARRDNAACHGRRVFRRPLNTHVLQSFINIYGRRRGRFHPVFLTSLVFPSPALLNGVSYMASPWPLPVRSWQARKFFHFRNQLKRLSGPHSFWKCGIGS